MKEETLLIHLWKNKSSCWIVSRQWKKTPENGKWIESYRKTKHKNKTLFSFCKLRSKFAFTRSKFTFPSEARNQNFQSNHKNCVERRLLIFSKTCRRCWRKVKRIRWFQINQIVTTSDSQNVIHAVLHVCQFVERRILLWHVDRGDEHGDGLVALSASRTANGMKQQ